MSKNTWKSGSQQSKHHPSFLLIHSLPVHLLRELPERVAFLMKYVCNVVFLGNSLFVYACTFHICIALWNILVLFTCHIPFFDSVTSF